MSNLSSYYRKVLLNWYLKYCCGNIWKWLIFIYIRATTIHDTENDKYKIRVVQTLNLPCEYYFWRMKVLICTSFVIFLIIIKYVCLCNITYEIVVETKHIKLMLLDNSWQNFYYLRCVPLWSTYSAPWKYQTLLMWYY